MDMKERARREIEIACERERSAQKSGEWDYGVACYKSAYNSRIRLKEYEERMKKDGERNGR